MNNYYTLGHTVYSNLCGRVWDWVELKKEVPRPLSWDWMTTMVGDARMACVTFKMRS